MPSGAIGSCWAQTPTWSTTVWEANTWEAAGAVTPPEGSTGSYAAWQASVIFSWLLLLLLLQH